MSLFSRPNVIGEVHSARFEELKVFLRHRVTVGRDWNISSSRRLQHFQAMLICSSAEDVDIVELCQFLIAKNCISDQRRVKVAEMGS